MNRIAELLAFGQSCWMDDLTRRMIESGDLARRVADEGLRGITSNPTIFAKAISGSPDYDPDIAEAATAGQTAHQIYETLLTTLTEAARETKALIVVEDHAIDGGLGDSVAAAVGSIAPVHRLGITQLPRSGKAEELLDRYGISRGAIQKRVLQLAA